MVPAHERVSSAVATAEVALPARSAMRTGSVSIPLHAHPVVWERSVVPMGAAVRAVVAPTVSVVATVFSVKSTPSVSPTALGNSVAGMVAAATVAFVAKVTRAVTRFNVFRSTHANLIARAKSVVRTVVVVIAVNATKTWFVATTMSALRNTAAILIARAKIAAGTDAGARADRVDPARRASMMGHAFRRGDARRNAQVLNAAEMAAVDPAVAANLDRSATITANVSRQVDARPTA